MRIFTDHLEDVTRRRGLYCVWVPASTDAPLPLVARWIDPQAERHEEHETAHATETADAGITWLRLTRVVA